MGGLALEFDGFQFDIELDEMSCQSGSCAWANVGVSLATPRHHGIVIVVPELMACQAELGVSNYTTPAPPTTCNTGWIGDYYCDDINNNMDCNYDGGDCCGCNANTQYCTECQCLDPNGSGGGTTCPQTTTPVPTTTGSTVPPVPGSFGKSIKQFF